MAHVTTGVLLHAGTPAYRHARPGPATGVPGLGLGLGPKQPQLATPLWTQARGRHAHTYTCVRVGRVGRVAQMCMCGAGDCTARMRAGTRRIHGAAHLATCPPHTRTQKDPEASTSIPTGGEQHLQSALLQQSSSSVIRRHFVRSSPHPYLDVCTTRTTRAVPVPCVEPAPALSLSTPPADPALLCPAATS